jgi:hypothetical protein
MLPHTEMTLKRAVKIEKHWLEDVVASILQARVFET